MKSKEKEIYFINQISNGSLMSTTVIGTSATVITVNWDNKDESYRKDLINKLEKVGSNSTVKNILESLKKKDV